MSRPAGLAAIAGPWVAALLLGGAAAAQEPPPLPAPPAPEASLAERVRQLLDADQPGSATVLCADAPGPLAGGDRQTCAQAHLALGDRLAGLGALDAARRHWRVAVDLDPSLVEDPELRQRLAPAVTPPPPPPEEADPALVPHTEADPGADTAKPPPLPSQPAAPPPLPLPQETSAPSALDEAAGVDVASIMEPGGPRAGRGLGLGLGLGFDGLLAVTAAWMVEEIVSLEVSVGLIFPTLDTRVRLYGFRSSFTPVFGVGLTHPFDDDDHFGASIPEYEHLYTLGPSVHFDLGLSWAPVPQVDVFAGAAFVTTLDGKHPDQIFFFPQFAVQALYYF